MVLCASPNFIASRNAGQPSRSKTFVACAMEISQYISDRQPTRKCNIFLNHFYLNLYVLLVVLRIKLTKRQIQPNHAANTQCRPGLVAAFKDDRSVTDEQKVES